MQPTLPLSLNDVLKDAHRINVFRGDDSYALTSIFPRSRNYIFFGGIAFRCQTGHISKSCIE